MGCEVKIKLTQAQAGRLYLANLKKRAEIARLKKALQEISELPGLDEECHAIADAALRGDT